jgi:hypothetical protein
VEFSPAFEEDHSHAVFFEAADYFGLISHRNSVVSGDRSPINNNCLSPCVKEVADVRYGCVLKCTCASKPEGEVVILPENRRSTMGRKGMLSNPDQANSLDIDMGLRGTCLSIWLTKVY